MKNHPISPALRIIAAAVLLAGTALADVISFDTVGNWDVDANWATGTAPWDTPTAPTDDLSLAAAMVVNSTETYTTGPNSGNPFQFRRVGGISSGKTLTIATGGTLDFGGGTDGRILLNTTGAQMLLTGGTLQSDSGNLGGVAVSGSGALIDISGSSTVDISDPGGTSQGFLFSGAGTTRGAIVRGSSASISLESLGIAAATANLDLAFELDASGASAYNVTDQVEWDNATGLSLTLSNPSLFAVPETLLLFDLANGSSGAFDSLVVGGTNYSGTEGTVVTMPGGAKPYKFTYDLEGAGDVGFVAVPEPGAFALFIAGAAVLLRLRRRRA